MKHFNGFCSRAKSQVPKDTGARGLSQVCNSPASVSACFYEQSLLFQLLKKVNIMLQLFEELNISYFFCHWLSADQ